MNSPAILQPNPLIALGLIMLAHQPLTARIYAREHYPHNPCMLRYNITHNTLLLFSLGSALLWQSMPHNGQQAKRANPFSIRSALPAYDANRQSMNVLGIRYSRFGRICQ